MSNLSLYAQAYAHIVESFKNNVPTFDQAFDLLRDAGYSEHVCDQVAYIASDSEAYSGGN